MASREELIELYKDGFGEDSDAFVKYFFDNIYNSDKVYTKYDGQQLICAAHVVMKKMKWRDKVIDVPFLVAVSTLTEYRGKQLIRSVMREAITDLRAKGYPFVMLYPFKHDYYRQYGFDTVVRRADVTLEYLKNNFRIDKTNDRDALYSIYGEYMDTHDICIYRDRAAMNKKLDSFYIDSDASYILYKGEERVGYALCYGEEVDELILCNNSIVDIDKLPIKEGNMARLLDVSKAFELLVIDQDIKGQALIRVIDSFLEDEIYLLTAYNGKIKAQAVKVKNKSIPIIDISIGDLTAMCFSYITYQGFEFLTNEAIIDIQDMY